MAGKETSRGRSSVATRGPTHSGDDLCQYGKGFRQWGCLLFASICFSVQIICLMSFSSISDGLCSQWLVFSALYGWYAFKETQRNGGPKVQVC